jgi:hypothetical protein
MGVCCRIRYLFPLLHAERVLEDCACSIGDPSRAVAPLAIDSHLPPDKQDLERRVKRLPPSPAEPRWLTALIHRIDGTKPEKRFWKRKSPRLKPRA